MLNSSLDRNERMRRTNGSGRHVALGLSYERDGGTWKSRGDIVPGRWDGNKNNSKHAVGVLAVVDRGKVH